jgi:hypothetical protein
MKSRCTDNKTWKYSYLVYALAVLAALAMIVISYKTTRSLGTTPGALLIRMSLTLPELVIWAIALRAAIKLKHYVVGIKHSDDGKGLEYISNGLLLLVAYIIALTLGSLLVQAVDHGSRLDQAIDINNYLPLSIALLSSVYLYIGSRRLAGLVGSVGRSRRSELRYVAVFAAFVALYVVNFYTNAAGLKGDGDVLRFDFPLKVLMFTYVLPHVIMWSLGLLACVNLAWYTYNTPGTLYKRMFRNFYQGILVVVISLFTAQVIMVTPITLAHVSVGLIVIYAVLVLAMFGFALIYRGTRKLEKIEAAS